MSANAWSQQLVDLRTAAENLTFTISRPRFAESHLLVPDAVGVDHHNRHSATMIEIHGDCIGLLGLAWRNRPDVLYKSASPDCAVLRSAVKGSVKQLNNLLGFRVLVAGIAPNRSDLAVTVFSLPNRRE